MRKRVNFSSNFGLNKCTKDRISELPDEILVLVLSLLTLKEAARTCVLSKRWINLWLFTTPLDFCDEEFLGTINMRRKGGNFWQKTRDYVDWVNNVLKLHKSIRLDIFRIAFPLGCSFGKDIDEWIESALIKSVQKLELDLLYYCRRRDKAYAFPNITGHSYLGFRSLRALRLNGIDVTGRILEFFLHSCLFLEELMVHESNVLLNLEISGPSIALKHLEICYCFHMESIVITDTNIVSIKVVNAGLLRLEKVPALVHVNVGDRLPQFWANIFSRLSFCLSQFSRLTLSMTDGEFKHLEHQKYPQLANLNELVFDVHMSAGKDMLPCIHLIRAAPFLKRLVFKMNTSCLVESPLPDNTKTRRRPLPDNLEVVEMCTYSSTSSELKLVMYLMENAPALKKLIIDPRRHDCSFKRSDDIASVSKLRLLAQQQFEGVVVPPHVQLVLL